MGGLQEGLLPRTGLQQGQSCRGRGLRGLGQGLLLLLEKVWEVSAGLLEVWRLRPMRRCRRRRC